MAARGLPSVSLPNLSDVLGKAHAFQALQQLVNIVTSPNMRAQVLGIATKIIDEAQSGGSILADPLPAGPHPKGGIEVAIDALHRLPEDDERLLATAFSGMLGDLCDLPDHTLRFQMLPPPGPWLTRPSLFLEVWLRWIKSASGERLFTIDTDLGIDRARLADQLDRIEDDEEACALVHGGHLRQALLLGRPLGDLTSDESEQLIRGFARALAVVVAHFRVALIGRWNRQPMTELVHFDLDWQTQARCMMSSLVQPAAAFLPILNLTTGPSAVSDLPSFLARTPLADPAFISLISDVGALCPGVGTSSHGFDQHMARIQAKMFSMVQDVAGIHRKDLVQAGLGKMSFVKDRLGLGASHGAVLVAWSMLTASATIDACVDAVLAGQPLPAPRRPIFRLDETVGLRKLGRATDHLRREVMPDRESSKMAFKRSFDSSAGHEMLRKAMRSFSDAYPEQAIETLWIDPRAWFA